MAIQLSQDESKCITLLKGLSILLVIFIHADFRKYLPSSTNTELFDLWMQIITRILVENAVPIFFFLSGFLFFLKKDTFKNKLKSRFRTLFIPYIFWTLWGFFIPFFLQIILDLEHYFTGTKLKYISDFTIIDYLRMFWDIRDGAPILSTLWFLRDLIVMVLLTPLIFHLIRLLKQWFILFIGIIYLFYPFYSSGMSSTGLFFFTLGAYFSIVPSYNIFQRINNSLSFSKSIIIWILSFISVILCYIFNFQYDLVMNLFIIPNSIMLYIFVYRITKRRKLQWLFKISIASFFIYAFHEPFMGYMIGIFFKIIKIDSNFIIYILPFFFVLITILFSYMAYFILNKICPQFLKIITGSRSK